MTTKCIPDCLAAHDTTSRPCVRLTDLPLEILSHILSEVYEPWWIEARGVDGQRKDTKITAKPRLPSLAPLLICRVMYRIGRDLPLHSLNGLLDISVTDFDESQWTRWEPLWPLINRVWVRDICFCAWWRCLAPLPSLRYVELFYTLPDDKDSRSEIPAGPRFPPPKSRTYDDLLKLIQAKCFTHRKTMHEELRICRHAICVYDPDPKLGEVDDFEASKGDIAAFQGPGPRLLDLVYDIYSNGRLRRLYKLLGYCRRSHVPARLEENTATTRPALSWLGLPEGVN